MSRFVYEVAFDYLCDYSSEVSYYSRGRSLWIFNISIETCISYITSSCTMYVFNEATMHANGIT